MPSTYREYASGSAALAASHLDPSRRPPSRVSLLTAPLPPGS